MAHKGWSKYKKRIELHDGRAVVDTVLGTLPSSMATVKRLPILQTTLCWLRGLRGLREQLSAIPGVLTASKAFFDMPEGSKWASKNYTFESFSYHLWYFVRKWNITYDLEINKIGA